MADYKYKFDLEPIKKPSRFKGGLGVPDTPEEQDDDKGFVARMYDVLAGYFTDEDEAKKALAPKVMDKAPDSFLDEMLTAMEGVNITKKDEGGFEYAPDPYKLKEPAEADTPVSESVADGVQPSSGKGLMSLPASESRSGVFEMAEADAKDIAIDKIGIDEAMWEAYKKQVSQIESGGEKNPYGAKGGYNKHYDGKYQVGKDAKADAASLLGITVGHSKKDREMFRKNPALQEKVFAAYTAKNHQYMLSKSEIYRNLDKEQQLAVLGYAHNQGAGGASKWLRSGEAERDGFDTSADKYYKAVAKELGITPSLAFTPGRETSPRPMLRPEEDES